MAIILPGLALLVWVAAPAPQAASAPVDAPGEYLRYEVLAYRDRVEADGSFTRTAEARMHLRTASAVAEWGQIHWEYVVGYGDVQFEKIVIDKPDGRSVEVRNGLVEDLNPFGVTQTSIAADVRYKKLTIPGLEPGDRLSYRIVLRQKPLAPGRAFSEIKLPPAIGDPVQTYELDVPRDAGIRVRLRDGLGAIWEEVPAPPDRLVRRLTLKVERPDPTQSITKAMIEAWAEPDVIFTRFSSWAEVAQWWWALSRDRLKPNASVKAEAAGLVASKATPREKIEALHAFVASRIRYVNVSFGLGRMQPRPAADVLANRYGDCKDKHALLAALASSLGNDLRPVLIGSTRSDLRDDVPAPQQFDHMISVARLGPEPANWLWLDTTNPFGIAGYLAPNLRDKRALLIEDSGEGRIVRTPPEPPFVPRTEVQVKAKLEPDRTLHGREVWHFRSDTEVQLRSIFATVSQDRRAEVVRVGLARDWKEGKVTNVFISDPSDVTEPFRIEFDAERPASTGQAQKDRSLWVPLPAFDLPTPEKGAPPANPAPLDVTPREFVARAEIEIPDGLNTRPPLSVSLDRPFGKFESAYSVEGRQLRLARTLRLSRRSISGDELASYEAFRKAIDTDRNQEFSMLGGLAPAPAASAEALHTEGLAAYEKKDYAKAVELLRKATETDARVKDGYEDLGRALRDAGKPEEALRAFSRQIEIDPFHEVAYAERAYELIGLNRWDEAEKDLLKQIEVAPFKAYSYERLGWRRMGQKRYREAADFYSRAAAIEPREAERWVDLGRAHQRDGRADEARAALDRARALDPANWVKIRAGFVYDAIGDAGTAGELAASALPSLIQRLTALSGESFGDGDLYWAERLAEAWYLIGAGALATGDGAKAERYLHAAWKLWFLPEAAWALGNLREKQGRLADAVQLWSMGSAVPTATGRLPADRQSRIDSACRRLDLALPSPEPDKLPQNVITVFAKPSRQRAAETALMDLRTIRLGGPVLTDLTQEVLLLVGTDGRVERVRGLSRKNPEDLDRQLGKLRPINLALPRPDDHPFKAVRQALLACSRLTACALVLDLPGLVHAPVDLPRLAQAPGESFGSIEIAQLDPPNGSTLHRGQQVKIVALVRYELQATERGTVILVVQERSRKLPVDPEPEVVVTRGSAEVTLTATFVVPQEGTGVDVFLALAAYPKGATSTVATAHYKVE